MYFIVTMTIVQQGSLKPRGREGEIDPIFTKTQSKVILSTLW